MNLQSGRSHNSRLSFEQFYEKYYERVFNFVYMRLLHREDAEDVTEDTFMKAMAAYDRNDTSKASDITWLCTIARNCMTDHIRKSRKGRIIPFDASFDIGEEDRELESLTEDVERRVYNIFRQLSPEERELLSMRFKMDMGYQEIGETLGIEPGTAAKRVERLLKKCREIETGGNLK
ncbi:MAG: sigma-70 family RNA polymerase sigma factor [Lachnospiraceae bacterium]|nr:sigma-70 family RNA polymerase sigma factor [Lachnospiraceae bacterium]